MKGNNMRNALTQTVFGDLLDKQFTLEDALSFLQSKRLLQVGELAELAISIKAGVELCKKNTAGIDTVTGKQIKHAQTQLDTVKKQAWISKKNTRAPILAVVTEQLTNEQYYFHIPFKAYDRLYGNAIGIPFHDDGRPYRWNSWWEYEVGSFEALCELAK